MATRQYKIEMDDGDGIGQGPASEFGHWWIQLPKASGATVDISFDADHSDGYMQIDANDLGVVIACRLDELYFNTSADGTVINCMMNAAPVRGRVL